MQSCCPWPCCASECRELVRRLLPRGLTMVGAFWGRACVLGSASFCNLHTLHLMIAVRMQQVLFGRYLATWIAQCSAAAVRLQLDADAEADDDDDDDDDDGDFFLLAVCTPCEQYGAAAQNSPNCATYEFPKHIARESLASAV